MLALSLVSPESVEALGWVDTSDDCTPEFVHLDHVRDDLGTSDSEQIIEFKVILSAALLGDEPSARTREWLID